MSENARIGESARYFVANQPMRYGIEIVYSLEVEHCTRDPNMNLIIQYGLLGLVLGLGLGLGLGFILY